MDPKVIVSGLPFNQNKMKIVQSTWRNWKLASWAMIPDYLDWLVHFFSIVCSWQFISFDRGEVKPYLCTELFRPLNFHRPVSVLWNNRSQIFAGDIADFCSKSCP